MIDGDGRAALTDFGLAKGRAYTALTQPGQVLGTVDYLAPELIRGEEAGPASDVYALACVVYECLTGRAPFADRVGLLRVATAHLAEDPVPPSELQADLPPDLDRAILPALAKEPAERPATASAFAHLVAVGAGRR
jgi:serine/threonine-protein kinase